MLLQLKDIKPNPFRDLKRNPINQAAVEELMGSIQDTGFWDNCIVRKNAAGDYELAFGHTRLEAAKKAGVTEANFIVRKWNDGQMLKAMDRENKRVYDNSVPALLESVRGVVSALAEGRIEPFKVDPKTNKSSIMDAPSFVPGVSRGDSPLHPYTALSVASYLGRTMSKGKDEPVKANDAVLAALGALHLIGLGILTDVSVAKLTVDDLLKTVRAIKKRHEEAEEHKQRALLDAKELQEKQSALDVQRREQEKKDRETEQARLRAVAAAKLEKDKAELAELEAEKKRNFERSQKRYAEIQEKRKVLDAKVEENNQRQEAFKPKPEAEIRVQGVSALRIKFDNVYSDSHGLTQEAVAMGRNQSLTPEERETLRQAMLKAGERLRYGSEIFLPPGVARMATKALREKAAKGNAEKFFKSNKGDKK